MKMQVHKLFVNPFLQIEKVNFVRKQIFEEQRLRCLVVLEYYVIIVHPMIEPKCNGHHAYVFSASLDVISPAAALKLSL